MKKLIEGLWIINHAGICLYNFETETVKSTDKELFGGLLTAIDILAKDVVGNGLNMTQMGDLNFYYAHRSSILFVLAAPSINNEGKVRKILNEIVRQFFNEFEEFVWTSFMERLINLELFASFDENVLIFTKDPKIDTTKCREDLADVFNRLVYRITENYQ